MAAPYSRHVFPFLCRNIIFCNRFAFNEANLPIKIVTRGHSRWFRPMLFNLNNQIKKINKKYGEEEMKPRSDKENWNYNSELYAFGKRLGEQFSMESLRTAFTNKCYIEKEEAARGELGLQTETVLMQLQDNSALATRGISFTSDYILTYLHIVYPRLPQDAIQAIHDYLMEIALDVARNLGIPDLTLAAEFPIPADVLKATFMSIIGALIDDQGTQRAGLFVTDFLLAQLVGKDLITIWNPVNAMKILLQQIDEAKRESLEPRILRQVGVNTAVPVFIVGIYCDKKMLSWAPGECISVAEEEATRVALRKLFGISESCPPIPLDTGKCTRLNSDIVQHLQVHSQQARISAS